MATSAQTLSTIIETLSEKFDFDKDAALRHLLNKELLPKKLIPSPAAPVKQASPWASKKAEEVAAEHGIIANGPGSGKDGKWVLADVKKVLERVAPSAKTKVNASPHAVKFALENSVDLKGRVGSGVDGKILLKDVQDWAEEDDDDDEDED